MSLQDRGISPNPFDSDFQLGQTTEIQRSELLEPTTFTGFEDIPPLLAGTLRGFAREGAIKGLAAIMAGNKIDLRVIQVQPEDPIAQARMTWHRVNLYVLGIPNTWVDMGERTFEEVEADIRQTISGDPHSTLAGIFRFTD